MYKMLAFVYANSAASEHSRLADKFADLRYFLYDLICHGKRRGILFLLHMVPPTYILFYHASMRDAMHRTCMVDLYVWHHISITYLSKSVLYNNCCSWLFSASSHRKCRGYCNTLSFESYCFLALSLKWMLLLNGYGGIILLKVGHNKH